MTTWKSVPPEKEVMWTCICHDTQNQIAITAWDKDVVFAIYDRPSGYWWNLWRALRGSFVGQEIILSKSDCASMAEELIKLSKA